MRIFLKTTILLAAIAAAIGVPVASSGAGVEQPIQFNRDIRPILNAHCFKCHGGVKEAGGLNLQFREKALLAGETGEVAIVPGKPEASAFFERLITEDKTDRMPKKEPALPPEQIGLLRRWVAEGAKWEKHWAYEPPQGRGAGIDELVGARLQREGLVFSPPAEIRTLGRRMALDVTGLPPDSARLDTLEKEAAIDRDKALRGFLDELLATPTYGERWAVPWLDLARYADSRGYEKDSLRDMWRYRDWVIDALNADMPYSEFVTEQLAGDLLPNATTEQVIATAFHRNTPQNDEGGTDDEEFRTYAVIDRVNTTFDALQGTSIGCVQCHGHPYDAFEHREYYQLMAFFNNTADADRGDQSPTRKVYSRADWTAAAQQDQLLQKAASALDTALKEPAIRDELNRLFAELSTEAEGSQAKLDALPKGIRAIYDKAASTRKPEEMEKLQRHLLSATHPEVVALFDAVEAARGKHAKYAVCDLPIMQELKGKDARTTQVFHRGNWMDKAEKVEPVTPQILNAWHSDYSADRLGFARWLTNGENPLTARVQVNRIWEQLFGVGLVETLEDFGSQGDRPGYQDVLDELAVRFEGAMQWSQKALLREIMLSRTYQQSSKSTPALNQRDPANRLLARGPRFRLSNEQIRDQALAVSGLLSHKMFGPPVMPYQPPGVWLTPYSGNDWKTSPGEDGHRRAIYTLIRRSAAYPSMVTFDAPNREFCIVRRIRTNTPLQSLDLLNSPVFMEAAKALAKRMQEGGGTLEEQIARGISLATLRSAKPQEIAVLKELQSRTGSLDLAANAILNLDEVLTKKLKGGCVHETHEIYERRVILSAAKDLADYTQRDSGDPSLRSG